MRVFEQLTASDEARRLYLTSPWYRRTADAVRNLEEAEVDPTPVLVDALQVMAREIDRQFQELVGAAQRDVRPMILRSAPP